MKERDVIVVFSPQGKCDKAVIELLRERTGWCLGLVTCSTPTLKSMSDSIN
jgi:hypothetical protein